MRYYLKLLAENETLAEVLTGTGIWSVAWLVLVLIFSKSRLHAVVGLLTGTALSVFYIINLYSSIDASLDFDEKGAVAYTRKKYVLRYLVVCVVYVAMAVTDFGSIYTCFAGIIGIKIGAYIQPFVRRYVYKRIDPPGKAIGIEKEM